MLEVFDKQQGMLNFRELYSAISHFDTRLDPLPPGQERIAMLDARADLATDDLAADLRLATDSLLSCAACARRQHELVAVRADAARARSELRPELEAARTEAARARSELAEMRAASEIDKATARECERRFLAEAARAAAFEKEVATLEKSVGTHEAAHKELQRTSEAQRREFEGHLESLRGVLDNVERDTSAECERRVQAMRVQIREHESSLRHAAEREAENSREVARLTQELKREREASAGDGEVRGKEMEILRTSIRGLEEQLRSEAERALRSVDDAQMSRTDAERSRADAKSLEGQLRAQQDRAIAEVSSLEGQLHVERDRSRDEAATLRAEIIRLKEQLRLEQERVVVSRGAEQARWAGDPATDRDQAHADLDEALVFLGQLHEWMVQQLQVDLHLQSNGVSPSPIRPPTINGIEPANERPWGRALAPRSVAEARAAVVSPMRALAAQVLVAQKSARPAAHETLRENELMGELRDCQASRALLRRQLEIAELEIRRLKEMDTLGEVSQLAVEYSAPSSNQASVARQRELETALAEAHEQLARLRAWERQGRTAEADHEALEADGVSVARLRTRQKELLAELEASRDQADAHAAEAAAAARRQEKECARRVEEMQEQAANEAAEAARREKRLRAAMAEATERVEDLEAQLAELQSRVPCRACPQRKREHEAEVDDMDAELRRLRAAAVKSAKRMEELEGRLGEAQCHEAELNGEVERLRAELRRLKSHFPCDKGELEIEALKAEVKRLKSRPGDLEQLTRQYEDTLEKLRQQLREATAKSSKLKASVDNCKCDCHRTGGSCNSCNGSCNSIISNGSCHVAKPTDLPRDVTPPSSPEPVLCSYGNGLYGYGLYGYGARAEELDATLKLGVGSRSVLRPASLIVASGPTFGTTAITA